MTIPLNLARTLKMKKHKVTERNVDYFRKRVEHWVEVWGMHDWEIDVESGTTEIGNMAELETNCTAKFARIVLAKIWFIPPTQAELDSTAHHEVLELLIDPLRKYYIQTDETIAANHTIIQRILNAFKRGKVK